MMRYARALTIGLIAGAALVMPGRAEAVTLREIMELTRAGVADDVILALIEIDQRVFSIDSETLTMLKQAGVSDKVMVAIVKSGRSAAAQPAPGPLAQDPVNEPPPPPQVYVVEREPASVREVVVPMPVYIAVPSRRSGHGRHGVTSYDNIKTPFNPFGPLPSTSLPPITSQAPQKPREPVYWGWGGKRRPDTWDPDPPPRTRKQ